MHVPLPSAPSALIATTCTASRINSTTTTLELDDEILDDIDAITILETF
jgi:hypothetical protein